MFHTNQMMNTTKVEYPKFPKTKTNEELFKTSKISHLQIAQVLYNANLQKNNNVKILNDESKF
jgi:hypothetical protein